MQNGCQFHIKFQEESKNEVYFNLRGYPMKTEVKAKWNFLCCELQNAYSLNLSIANFAGYKIRIGRRFTIFFKVFKNVECLFILLANRIFFRQQSSIQMRTRTSFIFCGYWGSCSFLLKLNASKCPLSIFKMY